MFDTSGIADLFGDVFSEIYDQGKLVKVTQTRDKGGDVQETEERKDVFFHPVSRSEGFRVAAGFADDVLEVIVLAHHLGGVPIVTDDRIEGDGVTYSVTKAKLDGPKSQWKCICKERKGG